MSVPQMTQTFLYFAYGSNMLTKRLQRRCHSARVSARGRVCGFRLTFSKISDDGSGKCTLESEDGTNNWVHGVLFQIASNEKPTLDKAEGLGRGYDEIIVTVVTSKSVDKAHVYVASAGATDSNRRAYHWYKGLVVAGSIEHELPETHIEMLWAAPSVSDPMPMRWRKLEAETLLAQNAIVWNWYQETPR